MKIMECIGVGTPEGLRAYLTTLRRLRGCTQSELATAMKLSRQGVIDWEAGRTYIINAESTLHAVRFLNGNFAHLESFSTDTATEEDGNFLALQQMIAPLSVVARQQIAKVLDIIADDIQAGRLPPGQMLSQAQKHMAILTGVSTEERQIIASVFRWFAEENRRSPVSTWLLNAVGRLFALPSGGGQP